MQFRNKFVFAFRALKANWLCSLISVVGLGLGLACMIMIAKYVWQEYTTDQFHHHYDRIYCCVSTASATDVPELSEIINCEDRIADYPEIKARTILGCLPRESLDIAREVIQADVCFTDPLFFSVFTFPLLAGDTATALKRQTDIVITEHFARKAFAGKDPMGMTISFWNKIYQVTGVMKDLPVNSSFAFDVLVLDRTDFSRMGAEFIVLNKGADIHSVTARLTDDKFSGSSQHFFYNFLPLDGLYFNTGIITRVLKTMRQGNIHSLSILLIAGIVILFISLVNYVNIYQVALLRRSRELGVKRVYGSGNLNLWTGFWTENLMMVVVAVLLALVLIRISVGWMENELGIPLRMNLMFDVLLCVGIIVGLPVLTSLLPFRKYCRMQPVMAMKSAGAGKGSGATRHVLLGLQYVMTLVMLIVSFYFVRQLDFMLHKDLGINQENIIHAMLFKEPKREHVRVRDKAEREAMHERNRMMMDQHNEKMEYVINEIQKYPYMQYPCAGRSLFYESYMPWKNSKSGMDYISCALASVDPQYLNLYGLQLKEGRFFESDKDRGRELKVVINETAMKKLGIESADGTLLANNSWGDGWRVLGIVKDFRFNHLSAPIPPLVMVYFGDKDDVPYQIQVAKGKEQEAIAFLQGLYEKMDIPGHFEYHFFEDEVQELYAKDKKVVFIAIIFTLLAVFISSIGLFGFAYFDARRRYREIAIRKVNGATATEVLYLLIRRFLGLIFITFVIASPIAWLLVRRYMENFNEYVALSWWLFALALLITGLVALLTLLWQSRKAAMANPIESLKDF